MESSRTALARTVNELTDALDPDSDDDLEETAEKARDRLSLLLERTELDERIVGNYNTGGRVRVKMDRGTSPRDQDQWVVEGTGQTATDAAIEFENLLERYEHEWADRVRDLDPYEGEE